MTQAASVIILVADGARPDRLYAEMAEGRLPAIRQLSEEGAFHTITTVFPSVTGPAYTPFLLGRHPASVGLPGIRWFDRTRRTCLTVGHSRSYVGIEMHRIDHDLSADVPTMFELAPSSLGALSVIERGLSSRDRIAHGAPFIARTAWTHFRGDVQGWLDIDRYTGDRLVRRINHARPAFTFAVFTGVDKMSHALGHESPMVLDALQIVDDTARQIREDAERRGDWDQTHLWIVSDHGHSSIEAHDDLAEAIEGFGLRVLAHPKVWVRNADVAVMVSGNAMAHLYIDLKQRVRPFWQNVSARYTELASALLQRESVDLMLIPTARNTCEVHTRDMGSATVTWSSNDTSFDVSQAAATRYTYTPHTGDPLNIGTACNIDENEAYYRTVHTNYPDSLVQIAHLCSSERCGDIILSATPGWDFRRRFEPIAHVSSHGALHRDHMLTPIVMNRAPKIQPLRTTDVMPSAMHLLGLHKQPSETLHTLHGQSFF